MFFFFESAVSLVADPDPVLLASEFEVTFFVAEPGPFSAGFFGEARRGSKILL